MNKAREEQEAKGEGPKGSKRKLSSLETRMEELTATVASLSHQAPDGDEQDGPQVQQAPKRVKR